MRSGNDGRHRRNRQRSRLSFDHSLAMRDKYNDVVLIPEGSYFQCLALKGPRLSVNQVHTVLPGLIVSNTQGAFDLEPHWVEWLGTIQAESFRESSLYITAVVDPQAHNTSGLSPILQCLDNRVRLFHNALVLLGCGYNNHVLMVGGERYHGGNLHIGPIRTGLTPCFRPCYRQPRKIEAVDLEQAATILTNLELIYSHAPARLYRRLRKGFNIWIRGAEEGQELVERLHAFLRATEAILKPTIARQRSKQARRSKTTKGAWRQITSTFVTRGQSIIGRSAENARLLSTLYDIRSSIEHVKDVMPTIRRVRGVDSDEAFGFRALQCEILASTIYSRILGSPGLLNAFSTETRVEGFWSRSGGRRQALWGGTIDVDAEARRHFQSHKIPEFY